MSNPTPATNPAQTAPTTPALSEAALTATQRRELNAVVAELKECPTIHLDLRTDLELFLEVLTGLGCASVDAAKLQRAMNQVFTCDLNGAQLFQGIFSESQLVGGLKASLSFNMDLVSDAEIKNVASERARLNLIAWGSLGHPDLRYQSTLAPGSLKVNLTGPEQLRLENPLSRFSSSIPKNYGDQSFSVEIELRSYQRWGTPAETPQIVAEIPVATVRLITADSDQSYGETPAAILRMLALAICNAGARNALNGVGYLELMPGRPEPFTPARFDEGFLASVNKQEPARQVPK